MKFRYERRLPRLGPSTLQLIVTLTPRMAVDACWSVIWRGSGDLKAIRKNWYVPGSHFSIGPPKTNGETHRVSNRPDDSRKRQARLDVAGHLLPVFRSTRPGVATLTLAPSQTRQSLFAKAIRCTTGDFENSGTIGNTPGASRRGTLRDRQLRQFSQEKKPDRRWLGTYCLPGGYERSRNLRRKR